MSVSIGSKYPGEREGQSPSSLLEPGLRREGQSPSPLSEPGLRPEGQRLSLRGLSVTLGGSAVLQEISLDLAAGEILALTGESGSGKSMTALAIMGLLPEGAATRGDITLGDTRLDTLTDPQMCGLRGRRLGMVFQEPMTALDPVMTIGAQVMETILIHRALPRAEARIRAAETLARVGLPPDQVPPTRYPHELSGGQRQRVVIAMAIALRPQILIADEPTTALDVTTQAQILDLLTDLVRQEGMGLLLVTHDLAVVAGRADRLAVMQAGRIVEEGPAADLLAAPRHAYTRALIAAARHQPVLPPRDPGGPLLQVSGLRRHHALPRAHPFAKRRLFHAVQGVDLQIRQGERVALVGASGCGKSTLARALLGLDAVQGGTITLAGHPVLAGRRADPDQRRRLQAVFQDPYGSFNPRHSVGRLISEPFHLLPDPPQGAAREAAVAEALRAVGLSPDHARSPIHAFSGGQRQRIAIARALIIRPDMVIFDEAVSALDVRVRAQILDLIADLSRSHGLAWLFISHDLSVVRGIADRVLVMEAGRIVEEGAPARIFDAPQHPATRALLAAAPHLPDPAG
ncbi:dipeptide ABC transporter ATP-binding protein [Salipiger marinus]|uniref:dipeptide ABC transporter ATP-binding protein n=1 Tax=Salipiger marinus TaxID=555512 RepID=UPI0040599D5D